MESIALLAGLAFAVNKIVSVIKSIGKDNNLVATQVLVWVVGIVFLFIGSTADVFESLVIPAVNIKLGDLDSGSIVLLGLILGSSGSFAYDALKSIDNTRSAAEPRLLGGKQSRSNRD